MGYFLYVAGYVSMWRDTYCLLRGIFCMGRGTSCMWQDTSCMSWRTFCLPQDTFDVTRVAVRKHENELEWLGTKTDTPFQLPSQ